MFSFYRVWLPTCKMKIFLQSRKTQTQNSEQIKLKFSNFSQSTAISKQKFLNPNFNFSTNSPKLKLATPKKKKKKLDIGKNPARLKPIKLRWSFTVFSKTNHATKT